IDRETAPRRHWLPWLVLLVFVALIAAGYPLARSYVAERRAPEVDVVRATQVVASAGGSTARPVLVATGYVVARHSSDVGVKVGGRIARLGFEEGTRVRKGAVIAEIEHLDVGARPRSRGRGSTREHQRARAVRRRCHQEAGRGR